MRLLRLQFFTLYAPGLPRCHEWWSRTRGHGGERKRAKWGPWVGKDAGMTTHSCIPASEIPRTEGPSSPEAGRVGQRLLNRIWGSPCWPPSSTRGQAAGGSGPLSDLPASSPALALVCTFALEVTPGCPWESAPPRPKLKPETHRSLHG